MPELQTENVPVYPKNPITSLLDIIGSSTPTHVALSPRHRTLIYRMTIQRSKVWDWVTKIPSLPPINTEIAQVHVIFHFLVEVILHYP